MDLWNSAGDPSKDMATCGDLLKICGDLLTTKRLFSSKGPLASTGPLSFVYLLDSTALLASRCLLGLEVSTRAVCWT